ncbi:MAG: DUF368 domain-containing protein [Flavobacteriaceae bacterium]|nr:MAG: DUF368 domain-containing protein [Flavobacteriaceae bacterium]
MMFSFRRFNIKAWGFLSKGRFAAFSRYVRLPFLASVQLGSFFSLFTFSLGIDYLIKWYPAHVWGFFFGLILGSIFYISKSITQANYKVYLSFILVAIFGIAISFMEPLPANPNLFFVAFCGYVSVCGIPFPGFSGSFLLILLGNYELIMVDSVNNIFYILKDIFQGDFGFIHNPKQIELLQIALVAVISSLIGIVTLARLINYLLDKFHDVTLAGLIGFITGSLGVAWPWKNPIYQGEIVIRYQRYLPEVEFSTFLTIIYIILGAALVIWIYYKEQEKKIELQ